MESARLVFLDGFAKVIPPAAIRALLVACETDDPRLCQGSTTVPPPLMCVQDWPVESGCGLAFCAVGLCGGFCPSDLRHDPEAVKRHATVGQVEEKFAEWCFEADKILGEPGACRWFLNYFDDTPRDDCLRNVALWCREALAEMGETV